MNLLGAQVREMKSMSDSLRNLEGNSKFPYSKLLTVVIIAKKNWLYTSCLSILLSYLTSYIMGASGHL